MKGYFIAFEGANGVGKSTIIKCIHDKLMQDGLDVFLTKEPSESAIGKLSREVADKISGKALACLTASDRFFHVENEIVPQIDKGKIVLCDRNILSAYVFNKMDKISFEYTDKIYEGIRYPDLIILLSASPERVHARLLEREKRTRYESAEIGLEQSVINESVEYFKRKKVPIFEIGTECSIEDTAIKTYHIIKQYISGDDKSV